MQKKITLLLILNALNICSFSQIHKDITITQADSLITANLTNPDFNILDVRTFEEYTDGHIPDAINIDYYSPTFRIQLDSLDKNDIYLVYCSSGNRSGRAVDTMQVSGFIETYNMLGGISAWISAGYQTVNNIKEYDDSSMIVEIYPNPASDFFTFVINRNSKVDLILNIYNITGSLVKTEMLKYNEQQIYTGDLSNGVYMVEIQSKGVYGIEKLIIKR